MILPSAPPLARPRTPTAAIVALFEQRTGQVISEGRAWRIEAALKPVLRDLSLADLSGLVARINGGDGGALADRVVDALLNHETSFFRDGPVLDHAIEAVVAAHAAAPHRRIRIWSAGCSLGQEPLSLAMLCEERGLGEDAVDIVATDISADAIARAKAARFSQFEIQRGLPVRRMMTWFEADGADWIARRELVRRVQFRRQNLVGDPPPPGMFDLILCRNVLLYFATDVRRGVFSTLARAMRPGGLLVLGAGETVIGQSEMFEAASEWRGFYRRTSERV